MNDREYFQRILSLIYDAPAGGDMVMETQRRLEALPVPKPLDQRIQSDPSPCCESPMMLFVSSSEVMCHECRKMYKINYKSGRLLHETD